MTFSEIVKDEILNNIPENACCKVAFLSAFIRGAGTFVSQKGFIGVEIFSENKKALEFAISIINSLYGITPKITLVRGTNKGKSKYKIEVLSVNSFEILKDLGFFEIEGGDVVINMNIDKYVVENDCCKKYFVIGAFMGNGSVTIPKIKSKTYTNYHLEFVFSNYKTASDFSALISELGFIPKHVPRKDTSVVYFKSSEEIGAILVYLGAKKSYFELESVIIERDITNETNRRVNCEMANIDKQINASEAQINNIKIIEETVGLQSLPPQLLSTAKLRVAHPDLTLTELSTLQGITKSCLNHRLRKIAEIAKNCTL